MRHEHVVCNQSLITDHGGLFIRLIAFASLTTDQLMKLRQQPDRNIHQFHAAEELRLA